MDVGGRVVGQALSALSSHKKSPLSLVWTEAVRFMLLFIFFRVEITDTLTQLGVLHVDHVYLFKGKTHGEILGLAVRE